MKLRVTGVVGRVRFTNEISRPFVVGNSRDTSTTPEPSKYQELKLNFGPNKSLSYLDRMLLKKHHGNPTFTSPQTPKGAKSEGTA